MKKLGIGTYRPENPVGILNYQAFVGQKEKEGPLGAYFDFYNNDEYFGQDTYEKAEAFMQKEVINSVIHQSKISTADIDFVFAGDLLNQCIGSNYGVRGLDMQYFGVYGACSTMVETLILASMSIDGGFARKALAVTSSHFCTAERQFRFPLEYGSQRAPMAQWTVTGAGCVLLSKEVPDGTPKIAAFCPGTICDFGINDSNNMGAAMAPAAASTLKKFFNDTATTPDDYDIIVTGDLGVVGEELLKKVLSKEGICLGTNYQDCGTMIYHLQNQDVHAGGSGCGCCASVLCGYLLPAMQYKKLYKNILVVATGALMSTVSTQQGESIPGIAHLIHITI